MNDDRYEFLKKDFLTGFTSFCGFEVKSLDYGRCEAFVKIRPQLCQREGFAHAGLIAALADHTGGYAAYSTVSEGIRILTIEFKVNFFKPAVGDSILCRARVVHKGKTVIVSESEVFALMGEQESLVSRAIVTMMASPSETI